MAIVTIHAVSGSYQMGQELTGMSRCPHCGVAAPHLSREWASPGPTDRADGRKGEFWGAFRCATCGGITTVRADIGGHPIRFTILRTFPSGRSAHEDLPAIARQYLQQAYETLHAPDAAAMVAGSAVDAMLKERGLVNGSLYSRIDEALSQNILTNGMAEWAHSVRLGSNRPRHSDTERPHVTPEEARQSVDFAEALGNFLFVLTSRIERGITAAKATEEMKAEGK